MSAAQCLVCLSDQNENGAVLLCSCGAATCKLCLFDYVVSAVRDGATSIKCIGIKCGKVISDEIVYATLGTTEWSEKYQKFQAQAMLEGLDGNMRYCPNPKCSEPILGGDPCAAQFWKCPYCTWEFCSERTCMRPRKGHPKECAAVFDQLMEQFVDSENMRGDWIVTCPGCKFQYQKIDGCAHLTCPRPSCGTEFCYDCEQICFNEMGQWHACTGRNVPPPPPPPPPTRAQKIRATMRKIPLRKIAIVASAPIWVPVTPLILAGYGVYQGGLWAVRAHHRNRQRKYAANAVIVHPHRNHPADAEVAL